MKTFDRQVYLVECMEWHEKRFIECVALYRGMERNHPALKTVAEKINYHTRQARWFKRLLQQPVRSSDGSKIIVTPLAFDGTKTEPIPGYEILEVKMDFTGIPQYTRNSLENLQAAQAPRDPGKPSLFRRIWNKIKGEK